MAEPAKSPAQRVVVVAGFWHRALAGFLDACVVVPVALLLSVVLGGIVGVGFPPARHRGIDYWLDLVLAGDAALTGALSLIAFMGLLYLFLFQALAGRTLGMRLLGLSVIDVYGDRPSLTRAALRTLGYLVCGLTLNLGFLWIGFDRDRRGLHDWLAGTFVIRADASV